ncbi:MAG: hypothetical protein ACRC7I_06000 [Selenomonadaceae bacterium]
MELFVGRDDQDRDMSTLKLKNGKVSSTEASNPTLLEVLNFAHKLPHGSLGAYIAEQDDRIVMVEEKTGSLACIEIMLGTSR